MLKRHTSKTRRRHRAKVLEVRVVTPRIAWFGFLRVLGTLTRLACIAALLGGLGWGVWLGIQRAFYENPDFRLQAIDLNPNQIIDETGVARAVGLDLRASVFEIDLDDVAGKLKALPGISDARAERHLPGTLFIRVVARAPRAWISREGATAGIRRTGGMLVDPAGFPYPCPPRQLEDAMKLPVIELSAGTKPVVAGRKIDAPELAHCFRLLDSASAADEDSIHWIESVRQANGWSLLLVTRGGTEAIFGLGDHERQIRRLRLAVQHASRQGVVIGTINLIPERNVPVTLIGEPPPRAIPVAEPPDRRTRDLNSLLNRN